MPEELLVKKLKLSDGQYYTIFDNGALRLDANGNLITGNDYVDEMIINGHLYITEIDEVPVGEAIEYVLVYDPATHGFKKRSIEHLLEDAGGASAFALSNQGALSLKIGK